MEYDTKLESYSIRLAPSQLPHRQSRNPLVLTPKRHSARIEKPRSMHHSPRVPERRRTFTSSKQFASLDDHYRAMFGDSNEQESAINIFSESVRPVSWHPSSVRFSVFDSRTSHVNASTSSHNPSTSQDRYGLTVMDNDHQSLGANSLPQYQATPMDFLSIQHSPPELQDSVCEEDNQLEKQKSRELIGMGLYDPPGSTPPSFGFGREGKGLKLEEEWEPPEPPDDDDDIDNEADQESSADEEETPDPPKAQEQQWGMQASILPPPTNLSGKTFFFDDDDTITNEWWYQQLKKPTVQDAGIGYGWLQHA